MANCGLFVCALFPSLPASTLYVVCCSVCMPMPNCMSVRGGGGVHMCMHASSVLVAMSVYVMHPTPPTQVHYLCFVLYPFYESRLERLEFYPDIF